MLYKFAMFLKEYKVSVSRGVEYSREFTKLVTVKSIEKINCRITCTKNAKLIGGEGLTKKFGTW